jgi:hypothetical protein
MKLATAVISNPAGTARMARSTIGTLSRAEPIERYPQPAIAERARKAARRIRAGPVSAGITRQSWQR